MEAIGIAVMAVVLTLLLGLGLGLLHSARQTIKRRTDAVLHHHITAQIDSVAQSLAQLQKDLSTAFAVQRSTWTEKPLPGPRLKDVSLSEAQACADQLVSELLPWVCRKKEDSAARACACATTAESGLFPDPSGGWGLYSAQMYGQVPPPLPPLLWPGLERPMVERFFKARLQRLQRCYQALTALQSSAPDPGRGPPALAVPGAAEVAQTLQRWHDLLLQTGLLTARFDPVFAFAEWLEAAPADFLREYAEHATCAAARQWRSAGLRRLTGLIEQTTGDVRERCVPSDLLPGLEAFRVRCQDVQVAEDDLRAWYGEWGGATLEHYRGIFQGLHDEGCVRAVRAVPATHAGICEALRASLGRFLKTRAFGESDTCALARQLLAQPMTEALQMLELWAGDVARLRANDGRPAAEVALDGLEGSPQNTAAVQGNAEAKAQCEAQEQGPPQGQVPPLRLVTITKALEIWSGVYAELEAEVSTRFTAAEGALCTLLLDGVDEPAVPPVVREAWEADLRSTAVSVLLLKRVFGAYHMISELMSEMGSAQREAATANVQEMAAQLKGDMAVLQREHAALAPFVDIPRVSELLSHVHKAFEGAQEVSSGGGRVG